MSSMRNREIGASVRQAILTEQETYIVINHRTYKVTCHPVDSAFSQPPATFTIDQAARMMRAEHNRGYREALINMSRHIEDEFRVQAG